MTGFWAIQNSDTRSKCTRCSVQFDTWRNGWSQDLSDFWNSFLKFNWIGIKYRYYIFRICVLSPYSSSTMLFIMRLNLPCVKISEVLTYYACSNLSNTYHTGPFHVGFLCSASCYGLLTPSFYIVSIPFPRMDFCSFIYIEQSVRNMCISIMT